MLRRPTILGRSPFQITRHAPNLGEHTAEVLSQAGLSKEQIAKIEKLNDDARSATEGRQAE